MLESHRATCDSDSSDLRCSLQPLSSISPPESTDYTVVIRCRYFLLPDSLNLDALLVDDAPKQKAPKVKESRACPPHPRSRSLV